MVSYFLISGTLLFLMGAFLMHTLYPYFYIVLTSEDYEEYWHFRDSRKNKDN